MPGKIADVLAVSSDVKDRLKCLDEEFEAGELTKKGYWKKKLRTVSDLLSDDVKQKVEDVEEELKAEDISEKGYFRRLEYLFEKFITTTDLGSKAATKKKDTGKFKEEASENGDSKNGHHGSGE